MIKVFYPGSEKGENFGERESEAIQVAIYVYSRCTILVLRAICIFYILPLICNPPPPKYVWDMGSRDLRMIDVRTEYLSCPRCAALADCTSLNNPDAAIRSR